MSAHERLPALGCLCGKRMMEDFNEGTCVWCGHGLAREVIELAYARNMAGNVPVLGLRVASAADARVVPIRRARSHSWDEDGCAMVALRIQAETGRFPSSTQWQRARTRGEHRPTYRDVHALFGGWQAFKDYCADIPREQVA
jgi:hypothetical protein